MNRNVEKSIRAILEICGKSGLAQYQIVDILPNSPPKKVVSTLKKMSKAGEIKDSKSGIIRLYHLANSPRYSVKDYKGYHSLCMA